MPTYQLTHHFVDGTEKVIPFEAHGDEQARRYLVCYLNALVAEDAAYTWRIWVYVLIVGTWSFEKDQFTTRIGEQVAEWNSCQKPSEVEQPQEAP